MSVSSFHKHKLLLFFFRESDIFRALKVKACSTFLRFVFCTEWHSCSATAGLDEILEETCNTAVVVFKLDILNVCNLEDILLCVH